MGLFPPNEVMALRILEDHRNASAILAATIAGTLQHPATGQPMKPNQISEPFSNHLFLPHVPQTVLIRAGRRHRLVGGAASEDPTAFGRFVGIVARQGGPKRTPQPRYRTKASRKLGLSWWSAGAGHQFGKTQSLKSKPRYS